MRRRFLTLALVVSGIAAASVSGVTAGADQPPLKIGFITSYSGSTAAASRVADAAINAVDRAARRYRCRAQSRRHPARRYGPPTGGGQTPSTGTRRRRQGGLSRRHHLLAERGCGRPSVGAIQDAVPRHERDAIEDYPRRSVYGAFQFDAAATERAAGALGAAKRSQIGIRDLPRLRTRHRRGGRLPAGVHRRRRHHGGRSEGATAEPRFLGLRAAH